MNENVVLFVNAIRPATLAALDAHSKKTGQKLIPIVFVDINISESISKRNGQNAHTDKYLTVQADFDNPYSIRQALEPFKKQIISVTCQYENSIHELKKIIPYLPYIPTPSELSLLWSTEKKQMRDMLGSYDPGLVPQYIEVSDTENQTLENIEESLSYPVIIKPSGLEGSLLVTLAKSHDELAAELPHIFQEIQKAYDIWIKRQKPVVLVEEFMVGDMYSVDVYVDAKGNCRFTPIIKVVTGHKIGFSDFFGYMRLAPAGLNKYEQEKANTAAEMACHALGLRSITAHVELMQTNDGWKIIELGPRIGGYRHDIYNLAYGINHIVNDILNRAGQAVTVPDKLLQNTAVFNMYAKNEGVLEKIEGIEQIRELTSFVEIKQIIEVGSAVLFAKNNGDPILEIIMSHPSKKQFEKDVAKLEKIIQFTVSSNPLLITVK